MTDYTELLELPRYCSSKSGCMGCKLSEAYDCTDDLTRDAAAAIEDLQAEVKRLKMHCADCEYGNSPWPEEPGHEPKRGQYVHGRELSREYIGNCLVSIDYEDWRCSVCGIVFEQWSMPTYNYCPNCGAKMEVQE